MGGAFLQRIKRTGPRRRLWTKIAHLFIRDWVVSALLILIKRWPLPSPPPPPFFKFCIFLAKRWWWGGDFPSIITPFITETYLDPRGESRPPQRVRRILLLGYPRLLKHEGDSNHPILSESYLSAVLSARTARKRGAAEDTPRLLTSTARK